MEESIELPSSPTQRSDPIEELFDWNPERPRKIDEYIDGDYSKAFNRVAPELQAIGGLGPARCVKKNRKQVLVNRPTLVQRISHTTTKLLPNFSITDEMKPVVCREKAKRSMPKHVERVKFAENLPEISTDANANGARAFNHENPLNLDLAALNDFKKRTSDARDKIRQQGAQIVRRFMETKRLKSVGAEEILQEERDKKFQLPAFFDTAKRGGEMIMSKIDEDETDSSNASLFCAAVSLVEDKPKNRKLVKLHYQHKREKLRRRLLAEKAANEVAQREMQQCRQREQENLIFRLADECFPASECNYDEPDEIRSAPLHFENRMRDFELSHPLHSFKCGQRLANEVVVLRGFRDTLHTEPRGRDNLHTVQETGNDDCATKRKSQSKAVNDLLLLRKPPKGKLFSSLRGARDPNDDKTCLFPTDASATANDNELPTSAIRRHIQQIDSKVKQRNCKSRVKKMRAVDADETRRRYQRMSFMGIPTQACGKRVERIVGEIASSSRLTRAVGSTSKDNQINAKLALEGMPKLMPVIPTLANGACDDDDDEEEKAEDECEQSRFVSAKPRGSDPKMLRIDKSLPWIRSDVDATRAKLQSASAAADTCNATLEDDAHVRHDKERDGDVNQSHLKRCYNDIIAAKRRRHYDINNSVNGLNNDDRKSESGMQSMQSASTLSSTGTNFTDDSGSFIVVLGEKIHMRQLNDEKNFQEKSLVTTKPQPPAELNPFHNDNIVVMRQLLEPPDRFHTQRTRSRVNINQRVKVKSAEYEEEIIGHKSLLAADIDESYTKEFYQERSRSQYRFKRVTDMMQLREGFRKHFESFYIREKLLRDKVQADKDRQALQEVTAAVREYERFLQTNKDQTHRRTMRKLQELKNYYIATEKLRTEHDAVSAQIVPMKMRIFNLGNEFVQRVHWQNFQYLLMPIHWRQQHDHLHRRADGSMEDYRASIESREVRNLWDRSCVGVDTIMDFINDTYAPKRWENLETFANADEFMAAYRSLESKSYKVLEKLTCTDMALVRVQHELRVSEERSRTVIEHYEMIVMALKKRWKFIARRTDALSGSMRTLMERPLRESLSSPLLTNLTAVTDILYRKLVCTNNCGIAEHFTSVEKFAEIEDKVLSLFVTLEKLPRDLVDQVEKEVRKKRRKRLIVAEKAYKIELNIDQSMTRLIRLLAKPPKKEKRVGKLPRSVIPQKSAKTVEKPALLSPLEEEYARAFTEFTGEEAKLEDVKELITKIKNQSIPFYIDRLLDAMGYTIGRFSPWDIERVIKDEEARMAVKDVLPEVRKRLRVWEMLREKEKNENIQKTLYLYEQVKQKRLSRNSREPVDTPKVLK